MSSFFTKANDPSRHAVYVGKSQDSLFRACAGAILDNFLVHPQLNRESLKKIMENHLQYYPAHPFSNTTWMTPSQYFKILLEKVPMAELIPSLAYTLRQLTVDEITSHRLHYADCMRDGEKFIGSDTLRKANAPISPACLEALAQSLNMPITLRHVVPGKELPAPPIHYHQKSMHSLTNPAMEIEKTAEVYKPRLVRHQLFLSDVYDSHPVPTPSEKTVMTLSCFEGAPSEAYELRLIQSHECAQKTKLALEAFCAAGDCDTHRLMQLFIQKREELGVISDSLANSHRRTLDEDLKMQLIVALASATKERPQLASQILEQLGGEQKAETAFSIR